MTPEEKENESNLIIDVPSVRAISVSVRGKRVFYESLTKEQIKAGERIGEESMEKLKPIVELYGREAVLTFKLVDGTKRRYRGNGGIILEPQKEMTDYARQIHYETLERESFLLARRESKDQEEQEKERGQE